MQVASSCTSASGMMHCPSCSHGTPGRKQRWLPRWPVYTSERACQTAHQVFTPKTSCNRGKEQRRQVRRL